ncbi:lipase secretion chaperone [Marinobacter sp. SS21]|uniref:lipase secretion chaperone n=1 Tax=Marinobacter sp. SS21 TaxID=2979460 RepID=UPI00232CEFA7|nr:lipase secretion chaperone [Marinobacter sp. SS21]MDC0661564.1 lipase secretion chaperone [Marinobacter sp. SS21]
MNLSTRLFVGVTLAIGAGLALLPPDRLAPTGTPAPLSGPPAGLTASSPPAPFGVVTGTHEALPPLPSHLANAEPEAELRVDADNNLIPTPGIRNLFDFYLAGLSDEPMALTLGRLDQALAARLQGAALAQARNLLQRYVNYRIELDRLSQASGPVYTATGFDLQALRSRQDTLLSLRAANFQPAERDAFFALEAAQDSYMLERLGVEQQPTLSNAQKTLALAELERNLPAPLREIRQRVTQNARLYEQSRQLRQAGASAEQLYQLRAEALGNDAAANLANLDRQRQQWQQRLTAFAAERDRIQRSGLSQHDQAAAIDRWINEQFTPLEARRVRALSKEI